MSNSAPSTTRPTRAPDEARAQPEAGRPSGLGHPDDNLKIPPREGEPPRPATEPAGSQGSARNRETLTDPATGEPAPNPRAAATRGH